MVQILIVDDEPLFREYLENFIPWNDYGFQIVGTAKNGVEALKLADNLQPDIVLTDINMPTMDGIEFVTLLLERAPKTGVIFITGHNEFEYARKAIRLGVSDYILKPFEKEELILTLLKLKDTIYEVTLDTNSVTIDSELLMPLTTSTYHYSPSFIARLEQQGIIYNDATYLVAYLDIDHLDYSYSDPEEKMLWRFSVSNILKELLNNKLENLKSTGHVFYDYEGNIVTLITLHKNEFIDYNQVFKHLMVVVNKYLNFSLTIGISENNDHFDSINTTFNEARKALKSKYIQGNNQIIEYSNLNDSYKDLSFFDSSINETLLQNLRTNNLDSLKTNLNNLYQEIKEKNLSIDLSNALQIGLINTLLSYIVQSGKRVEHIFGDGPKPIEIYETTDTLPLQQQVIISLFEQVIHYFSSNEVTRSQVIAGDACDIVHNNYKNQELSVTQIANTLYINQTYLRSMFKKEMNITISDYITKVRIETAATLIKKKTYRIADIAEEVGYSDSSYFSKCFKKYYGISPSKYELSLTS